MRKSSCFRIIYIGASLLKIEFTNKQFIMVKTKTKPQLHALSLLQIEYL